MRLSIEQLRELLVGVFQRNRCSDHTAAIMADTLLAAERDGARNHGVFRLPGFVSSLRSGWVDGHAEPVLNQAGGSVLSIDGRNGFAQVSIAKGRALAVEMARRNGISVLAIGNSHHPAALWVDLEPIAQMGLVALAFVNTRSLMVPAGGSKAFFGTNPMGFACPRKSGSPMIWDQASSVMSRGEVLLAARDGKPLPEYVGYDSSGRLTKDAAAIVETGRLAPFGGHKGSNIALMIEIMAAALTRGLFGFEDRAAEHPGAWTVNAGQYYILIDPKLSAGPGFLDRIETLFAQLVSNEGVRLPGERRYQTRRHSTEFGIEFSDEEYKSLLAF